MTQPIHIIAGGITLTIAANPDLKLDPIANLITEEQHDRRAFVAKQTASELYEQLTGNGSKVSMFGVPIQIDHLGTEIAALQKIIQDREQERDNAKAQAIAAAEQIVSLEAALSDARSECAGLRERQETLSAEVRRLSTYDAKTTDVLIRERDELRDRTDALGKIIKDNHASIEYLQAEVETLRNGTASNDHEEELFALKRERDELRTQIDDLATRLAKAEDERNALRNPQKIVVANEEQREQAKSTLTPPKQSKGALNAEQRDEIKQRVQTLRRSMANAPGVACKSQAFISIRNDQLEAVRKHLKSCHLDFIDAEEVDGKFIRIIGQQ